MITMVKESEDNQTIPWSSKRSICLSRQMHYLRSASLTTSAASWGTRLSRLRRCSLLPSTCHSGASVKSLMTGGTLYASTCTCSEYVPSGAASLPSAPRVEFLSAASLGFLLANPQAIARQHLAWIHAFVDSSCDREMAGMKQGELELEQ